MKEHHELNIEHPLIQIISTFFERRDEYRRITNRSTYRVCHQHTTAYRFGSGRMEVIQPSIKENMDQRTSCLNFTQEISKKNNNLRVNPKPEIAQHLRHTPSNDS